MQHYKKMRTEGTLGVSQKQVQEVISAKEDPNKCRFLPHRSHFLLNFVLNSMYICTLFSVRKINADGHRLTETMKLVV